MNDNIEIYLKNEDEYKEKIYQLTKRIENLENGIYEILNAHQDFDEGEYYDAVYWRVELLRIITENNITFWQASDKLKDEIVIAEHRKQYEKWLEEENNKTPQERERKMEKLFEYLIKGSKS